MAVEMKSPLIESAEPRDSPGEDSNRVTIRVGKALSPEFPLDLAF